MRGHEGSSVEKGPAGIAFALGLSEREHLSLVGGGGKTTLLRTLAGELRASGKKVVMATTTKMWQSEAEDAPTLILTGDDPSWRDKLLEALHTHGHVFLGRRFLDSGKVEGIPPEVADGLYREQGIDYLLLEADGSSGRPLKAHDRHEPVIPSSATGVVALMGLEALGRKPAPDILFRMDLFLKFAGIGTDELLTAQVLAPLFTGPEGPFKGTPKGAKRWVFLNKVDLASSEPEAEKLARLIFGGGAGGIDRVLMGSLREGRYRVVGHPLNPAPTSRLGKNEQ